jgi:hypothetical protein
MHIKEGVVEVEVCEVLDPREHGKKGTEKGRREAVA